MTYWDQQGNRSPLQGSSGDPACLATLRALGDPLGGELYCSTWYQRKSILSNGRWNQSSMIDTGYNFKLFPSPDTLTNIPSSQTFKSTILWILKINIWILWESFSPLLRYLYLVTLSLPPSSKNFSISLILQKLEASEVDFSDTLDSRVLNACLGSVLQINSHNTWKTAGRPKSFFFFLWEL